jgi:2-polyprenyl-3-methyl-5-hydroxy-6-metoxy-1,4-benzoquinol methylase
MGDQDKAIAEERDAFVERLLQSTAGVFDIFTVYIGDRLGLYRALAQNGGSTSAELAAETGTHERYVREWLEQQTVSGILNVKDESAEASKRQFSIPPGHVEVLVERDSLNYLASLTQLAVGVTHPVTSVVEAFRNGGGVPLGEYGGDFLQGQADINRPSFLHLMGTEWLPAMPDVHTRLQADPPAHIADIGCGAGWSSIAFAQHYPNVIVDGYDLDAPSIELAQANASAAGVGDRVNFHVRDAGDPDLSGQYDLVAAFEAIHDMSQPVAALRAMRSLAGEEGTVLVCDERVGEAFSATGNDVEWMMYGWSVLHCLPVGMADQPSVGTGTVMRTDTLSRYATEAGFKEVEVLPIENFFFRFYRLKN